MSSPLERAFEAAAGPDFEYCMTCRGPAPNPSPRLRVVHRVAGWKRPEEDLLCPDCGKPVDEEGGSLLAVSRHGVHRITTMIVERRAPEDDDDDQGT